ncbi:vWA domain-containing protein [Legionella londiniensis]|uniref:von Willebrand factor type A (VWA) domain-containing protein n=1 Tax=Legionella londiniensis TaxID=45068 RepID=A0A0W0VI84_9GAMM|nr:VWA domain-containing protein [Legionella londiniensis]KTD19802.1 Von Willebrand factor type A (vWA) domain-containing protein [Legionella londiniensis]STX92287.1 BatA [Legionella londiniensis]
MFELAVPWAFVFLPLPFLIWYFLPRASSQFPSALKVPFYEPLTKIAEGEKTRFGSSKKASFLFAIWALILLAFAGPRWVGEPLPVEREGYNIMLVLDISGSMELTDMMFHGRPVSRLTAVKQAAMQFVKDRIGDQIGLILFGSRAYLQTPLTYDRQNILMRLADATVGLAGKTTSIGDALGLAVKRFKAAPKKGRVIILLTDGVNNSGVLTPMKAAELAKAEDIKVYTIGLGSDADPQGLGGIFLNLSGDLDEETLKEIAKLTGGRYFRATDLRSLQAIYETINQIEKVTQKKTTVRPRHEYYPWPLALALILLLGWLANENGLFSVFKTRQFKEA